MRVEKDFEEFIRLLNKHRVQYVIIGAYAVSFHARPRNTGDIDLFVKRSGENAGKIMMALNEFGFGNVGLHEHDFLKPDIVVQLGYEPNRIDIVSSISGVDFEDAYESRVQGNFGKEKAWFISFDNLLRNKRAVKRKKDEADVQLLLKFRTKLSDFVTRRGGAR